MAFVRQKPYTGSLMPRFFVPEVVQSSGMDCGPAALKAFVEGHGLSVSYGRLREACQTDVDGTAVERSRSFANAPTERASSARSWRESSPTRSRVPRTLPSPCSPSPY